MTSQASDTRPRPPSQYDLDTTALVEMGRDLGNADVAALAAAFFAEHDRAPNPAAVEMAHLILTGEGCPSW